MKNRVCEVLGIEKPIIQGPMAWTSTAPLVAAVSNAGGLGVLGVGFTDIDFVLEQVRETRALTGKPFGINVYMDPAMGLLDKIVMVVEQERVPVVYAINFVRLDYDVSARYFDIWHGLGAKIVFKAIDIQDAVTAEKSGADVVIVKGWEGGGHVSEETTMALVPQAADALRRAPLVASGGIADGRGMAAVFAMGAEGIEMGSLFLATEEAPIHPNAKKAVVDCGDRQTVITGRTTDQPCWQIRNALSDEILRIEAEHLPAQAAAMLPQVAEKSLKRAMMEGDTERGAVMVGQAAPLIKSVMPVEAVMNRIMDDCRACIRSLSTVALS